MPPEPPLTLLLGDSFDAGVTYVWTLGAGWTFAPSEGGQALAVTNSDAPVTFVHTNLTNLAVQARLQLNAGMARLSLRQSEAGSYTALLDASGQMSLYRGGQVLGSAAVPPTTPGRWRTLRLSAIDNMVRVAVDGVQALAVLDTTPLPAGTIAFAGIGLGANTMLVDDVGVWVVLEEAARAAATPEPTLPITATPNLFELSQINAGNEQSLSALDSSGSMIFRTVTDLLGLRAVIQEARAFGNTNNTYSWTLYIQAA